MIGFGPGRRAVKDAAQEANLFRVRAAAGFLIIAVCLMVLIGRYVWLQVLRHDEFSGRADENRIKLRPLPPSPFDPSIDLFELELEAAERRLVYDRIGATLAELGYARTPERSASS